MAEDFSKATPRPWGVHPNNETQIFGADGKQIVSTDFFDGEGDHAADLDTSLANAALIVAAVNGYDAAQARIRDLEAALRELELAATEVQSRGATTGPHWLRLGGPLLKARAVLSSGAKP